MAIDTDGKKLSILNYMRVDHIVLPKPSGTISTSDKYTLLNMYGFGLGENVNFDTVSVTGLNFPRGMLFCMNINQDTGRTICLSIDREIGPCLEIEQIAEFILVR